MNIEYIEVDSLNINQASEKFNEETESIGVYLILWINRPISFSFSIESLWNE